MEIEFRKRPWKAVFFVNVVVIVTRKPLVDQISESIPFLKHLQLRVLSGVRVYLIGVNKSIIKHISISLLNRINSMRHFPRSVLGAYSMYVNIIASEDSDNTVSLNMCFVSNHVMVSRARGVLR